MARSERGASAVEFAIVFPILFLVIAGIVDFGRAYFYQIQLANAAREGARAAVIGTLTTTQIQDRAKAGVGGIPAADLSFPGMVTCGTTNASVTVQASFQWLIMGPAIRMVGGTWGAGNVLSSTAVVKCP
ncbi:TadE/TadG family type IV pilus assembly protein [Terrabacter sp. C0L_2]|uniref:TadE/TadG family type IV pilus assembly protein n=1 Tax=Terrabacter sp. C0L_2 TaxID=3108389 RepID=UPI002ED1999B|nr:TadE/TadG family type IV pilus assembly protein [Terrabacter sp. C0L_2]